MSDTEDQRSNFELIRDTLLLMDPETCHQTIAAMTALRALPVPVAVRILANAANREYLRRPVRFMTGA